MHWRGSLIRSSALDFMEGNVGLPVRLFKVSATVWWIATTCWTDIRGQKRKNLTDFSDPLTSPVQPKLAQHNTLNRLIIVFQNLSQWTEGHTAQEVNKWREPGILIPFSNLPIDDRSFYFVFLPSGLLLINLLFFLIIWFYLILCVCK